MTTQSEPGDGWLDPSLSAIMREPDKITLELEVAAVKTDAYQ
jgi:hypothetical protein